MLGASTLNVSISDLYNKDSSVTSNISHLLQHIQIGEIIKKECVLGVNNTDSYSIEYIYGVRRTSIVVWIS